MSRKKKTEEFTEDTKEETQSAGEQLDLIDVSPENSQKIIQVAKRYKTAQTQRLEALKKETVEKQKLLTMIKEANLQRLEDGKIKFRVNGLIITVTPRDELIKIKDENKSGGEGESSQNE